MSKRLDLTGKKFGRLTVLGIDEEKTKLKGKSYWVCKCECGKTISTLGRDLVNGHTKSCGCYSRDKTIERNTKHNLHGTRLYRIWKAIRTRCNNPNFYRYCDYGGRGITICKEWDDFTNFYNWAINNGYSEELSIDRINVNGNYEPSNCRWVDDFVQMNNTRKNVYLEINGETKSLSEWVREFDLEHDYEIIRVRYHKEGFQSVDQLFRDKAS